MKREDEITMVEEHVRQGEAHITRQHELMSRLRSLGADVGLAERLLANLEDAQTLHVMHLERLRRSG